MFEPTEDKADAYILFSGIVQKEASLPYVNESKATNSKMGSLRPLLAQSLAVNVGNAIRAVQSKEGSCDSTKRDTRLLKEMG